jgi:hypothetical protein
MKELLLRLGRAAGYAPTLELATRPSEPWRSADVGLEDSARRRLILVECWNSIGDVGTAARSSDRKRAEAETQGACGGSLGDRAGAVGVLWLVRSTARNRALVARYPEVFASRFAGSSAGGPGHSRKVPRRLRMAARRGARWQPRACSRGAGRPGARSMHRPWALAMIAPSVGAA